MPPPAAASAPARTASSSCATSATAIRWPARRSSSASCRGPPVPRSTPRRRRLAPGSQRAEEPLEDLVQVAALGLIKAIDRFSPEREVAFSSYAVPTILGELKRHFRDRTCAVRVPRDLQELALKVDRTVSDLSRESLKSPSV